jgi:hypothetical protein
MRTIYCISSPALEAVTNQLVFEACHTSKSIKAIFVLRVEERLIRRGNTAINYSCSMVEDRNFHYFQLLMQWCTGYRTLNFVVEDSIHTY